MSLNILLTDIDDLAHVKWLLSQGARKTIERNIRRPKQRLVKLHAILRAMHVRGVFSINDIMQLTDVSNTYIYMTVRRLIAEGYLEEAGKKVRQKIFRVRHRDKFYKEIVHTDFWN